MSDAQFGDGTKLDIRDGWIAYHIYGQDGSLIPMSIVDTPHNRRFVEWVQIHDRYVVHGEGDAEALDWEPVS